MTREKLDTARELDGKITACEFMLRRINEIRTNVSVIYIGNGSAERIVLEPDIAARIWDILEMEYTKRREELLKEFDAL